MVQLHLPAGLWVPVACKQSTSGSQRTEPPCTGSTVCPGNQGPCACFHTQPCQPLAIHGRKHRRLPGLACPEKGSLERWASQALPPAYFPALHPVRLISPANDLNSKHTCKELPLMHPREVPGSLPAFFQRPGVGRVVCSCSLQSHQTKRRQERARIGVAGR